MSFTFCASSLPLLSTIGAKGRAEQSQRAAHDLAILAGDTEWKVPFLNHNGTSVYIICSV